MTVRGWFLGVDWSGDGSFAGTLEDASSYVNREDIVASWGRPVDTLDTQAPAAECAFQLRNRDRAWDRWFSPENTASPIAGLILNGREVRFEKTVRGAGSVYSETAFTTSLGGWSAVSGGTLTRVASPSEDGDGALNYVPPGAVATVGITRLSFTDITVYPEATYVIMLRVRASAAFADAQAVIDWYDVAGALISSGTGPTTALASGAWTTVQSGPLTPPALAVKLRLRLRLGSTPPNTTTFNVDWASVQMIPVDADKTYRIFSGPLDSHTVDSASVARTFGGTALDGWSDENRDALSTPVYQGQRTGDLINVVLDAAGWTGGRSIDAGATVIPYWWEEGTQPAEAIDRLVQAEGPPAIAYVHTGTFHFHDRHHRIFTANSLTSRATFTELLPGSSNATGVDFKIEKGSFQYDHGLNHVVNTASFSVDVLRPQQVQEVWAQEDPFTLVTGTSLTVFAEPNDPVINMQTPDPLVDIQAQSGSFTATVDRTSGKKFIVTVTCTATGVLTRIALRGSPVTVARTVQVTTSDAGSVGRFRGKRTWPGGLPWANPYDAQVIADRIVSVNADYRPRITFTVPNFNDRYSSKMLSLRIGDRITIINEDIGVNREFYIERIEHRVSRLQIHRVTFSCIATEPTQAANPFTFGVAGQGFDQGAFAISGIDTATTAFRFDVAGQGFGQGLFAN